MLRILQTDSIVQGSFDWPSILAWSGQYWTLLFVLVSLTCRSIFISIYIQDSVCGTIIIVLHSGKTWARRETQLFIDTPYNLRYCFYVMPMLVVYEVDYCGWRQRDREEANWPCYLSQWGSVSPRFMWQYPDQNKNIASSPMTLADQSQPSCSMFMFSLLMRAIRSLP